MALSRRLFCGSQAHIPRAALVAALAILAGGACQSTNTESVRGQTEKLTADDGSTGVAVCDSYLDQYESCVIPKLPPDQVQRHRAGLIRQRTRWGDLTETPFKKAALARICRAAIDTARQEFPGCTFSRS